MLEHIMSILSVTPVHVVIAGIAYLFALIIITFKVLDRTSWSRG
jgi:hypothetical protein